MFNLLNPLRHLSNATRLTLAVKGAKALWRLSKPLLKSNKRKGLASTLLIASALALGSTSFAVSINQANQNVLESVKGVGPAKAKSIITEREKNGAFKDAEDLSRRVRGIGEKTVSKMQDAGISFDSLSSKSSKETRSRRTPARTAVSVGTNDDAVGKSKRSSRTRSESSATTRSHTQD